MAISTLEMGKDQWLKERQKGVGGSDVAAILGLAKNEETGKVYKTALEVYEEKIAPEPILIEENRRMKFGRKAESLIAEYYEEETGNRVQMDNKLRKSKDYPCLLANIDRQIISSNGRGPGVLECKATGNYAKWIEFGIPKFIYTQIQHYLYVTGYQWGALAVLGFGAEFNTIDVPRDEEWLNIQVKDCVNFWENYVVKRIPPDPQTSSDVLKLFPAAEPMKTIEADDNLINVIMDLKNCKERVKEWRDRKAECEEVLRLAMTDAEALIADGNILATWKNDAKPREVFDKKHLKEHFYEAWFQSHHLEPGSRRFLLK